MTAPPGLRIADLSLSLGADSVFAQFNLDLPPGRLTALLGASGVGKTTLLKIIAGLVRPDAGSVSATDGHPLASRIAYMAQQDLLYPWLDVIGNVMLGARLRRQPRDRPRALHLLDRVGLPGLAQADPATLSGGMRQRVALARTLYEDRPIVLMDEPFSALDSLTRARVQSLAAELLAGRTCLLITHDPLEACRMGDEVLILANQPATIDRRIAIDLPRPRAPDDPGLLALQGSLLRLLSDPAAA